MHAFDDAGFRWLQRRHAERRQRCAVGEWGRERGWPLRGLPVVRHELGERGKQRRRRERIRAGHVRGRLRMHTVHAARVGVEPADDSSEFTDDFCDDQPDRALHYVRFLRHESRRIQHDEPFPARHLRRGLRLRTLDTTTAVAGPRGEQPLKIVIPTEARALVKTKSRFLASLAMTTAFLMTVLA